MRAVRDRISLQDPSCSTGRPFRPPTDTALLVVWLHGGASHLETYDPKPLAPSEYRGPYRPIATRVPGLQLSELLPQQALNLPLGDPKGVPGPPSDGPGSGGGIGTGKGGGVLKRNIRSAPP